MGDHWIVQNKLIKKDFHNKYYFTISIKTILKNEIYSDYKFQIIIMEQTIAAFTSTILQNIITK